MDGKEYEDLKLEYIRRKMARNEKMDKMEDDENNSMMTGSGSTTRFTDNNDTEGRARQGSVFGKAMDFIFPEHRLD